MEKYVNENTKKRVEVEVNKVLNIYRERNMNHVFFSKRNTSKNDIITNVDFIIFVFL